jgi:hypothetical protein
MSDVSSGARAPDTTPGIDSPAYPATETYPAETYPAETYPATQTSVAVENYPATEASTDAGDSRAKQVAGQTAQAAGQAASDVKDTAKEQALRVGDEARTQIRNVASDVRGKVGEQARTQNDKLVGGIRQVAEELDRMRGDRQDSPAATVVSRVADGGRQMADYLDRNGPEGVLREVQDFARRRPGAFLATALAAGFVVGRLGKGVMKADDASSAGSAKPSSDSFVSDTDSYGAPGYQPPAEYVTTTEYASTGTGTPVAVEEDQYLLSDPAVDREYPGGAR